MDVPWFQRTGPHIANWSLFANKIWESSLRANSKVRSLYLIHPLYRRDITTPSPPCSLIHSRCSWFLQIAHSEFRRSSLDIASSHSRDGRSLGMDNASIGRTCLWVVWWLRVMTAVMVVGLVVPLLGSSPSLFEFCRSLPSINDPKKVPTPQNQSHQLH